MSPAKPSKAAFVRENSIGEVVVNIQPPLKILYIGNFEPEHSTENHVRTALIANGHHVTRFQESDVDSWRALGRGSFGIEDPDLILWTHTQYSWLDKQDQLRMLIKARQAGIPVVGFHLDIWWGLQREHLVFEEPFFLADLLCTADGGHDQQWADAGVAHHWMPPAVSAPECELGMFRDEFHSKLAFVGSWQGHYHQEHQHRFALVNWLQTNYGPQIQFWPKMGQPAVRGADLRDLYASVDVVVGDSCFTGSGLKRYWSDRIPETIGRGGYLIHPDVEGLEDVGLHPRESFGGGMATWEAGEWDALANEIEWALENPEERRSIAAFGRSVVLERHTYEVRLKQLVELLNERKML